MPGLQLKPKFGTTLAQATDLFEINAITDLVNNIIIISYFCTGMLTDVESGPASLDVPEDGM